MLSDGELLGRYLDDKAEAAFTELVQRHLNVVYFAALRRVGFDAHLAHDVTQRVFIDLARKAAQLKGRPSLVGWLHTATRFVAAETVRGEQRRRTHEHEAHAMNELTSPAFQPPSRFDPVLDEVLDVLAERDRDAVLLHFFEGRSFVEVGSQLSISADAARMRVNRALEQLHAALAKRGVESTAAVLATTLSAQSGLAAPASVAGSIAAGALACVIQPRALAAGRPLVTIPAAVAVLTLGVLALRPRPPAPAPAAPSTAAPPNASAPVPPAQPARRDAFSYLEVAVAEGVPAPTAAAEPASAPAEPGNAFAALAANEKEILKTLWAHEDAYPSRAGAVFAFSLPPAHPRLADFNAGRDSLQSRQLIAVGTSVSGLPNVRLTPAGKQFVRAWSQDLEAYPLAYPNYGPTEAPPAGMRFSDLTPAEKRILQRLAALDAAHPPAPGGGSWGFKQPPVGTENMAQFERGLALLIRKGWATLGAKQGIVVLTESGRAFCASQADDIAAFQAP